jgi:hypothetical protein
MYSTSYKKYNNIDYYMEIKIYNPDGDEWILNPMAIDYLEIEDDLHFWPIKGYLIYQNPNEIIERVMASNTEVSNSVSDANVALSVKNTKPYLFRNDGRDYIDITIYINDEENKLPKEQWVMKYNCVIYDKEDLEASNITAKKKKFYFWDIDYQKMLEQKIQWSTATSNLNPIKNSLKDKYDPAQATDEERKMFTGLAIKSILLDNGFKCSDLFDSGSTQIFYSTYCDKNIWQNIDYILQQHMSVKSSTSVPIDDSDICIFNKDRYKNEFELIPLNKFFEKAGNSSDIPKEYQLEHMFLEDTVGDVSTSVYKAPKTQKLDYTKDFHTGVIKSYQFVDMSGDINSSLIVTTPVHTYDFKNKTFSIHIENSNTETLIEKIKKKYIENKVLSKGLYPLISLNQNKLTNKNIRPVYSIRSDKEAINKKGLGSLLTWSLFLNECLKFEAIGLPIRQAGRFIGIDRMSFSDNKMDYKLLGQWFTTNVKHKFYGNGSYSNEIFAVKLHSYDDLGIKKDVN